MCLHVKQGSRPRKAKKDIIVYKCLSWTGRCFRSVYSTWYSWGNFTKKKEFTTRLDGYYLSSFGDHEINSGFHSYKSIKKAEEDVYSSSREVVEFVIPKGALYWAGSNNGDSSGYCSDTLKFVKVHKKAKLKVVK